MAGASGSHDTTTKSDNLLYECMNVALRGPHSECKELNFNRYIWCLSGDAARKKWWLGRAGPMGTLFQPPTKDNVLQYRHRIQLDWKPYTPGTCAKCNTKCFLPVWTGLKKDKKYSKDVANLQDPEVVDGYVQGANAQGIELTGESRLTFCKTCWKNVGHRSSVSRYDHPHGEDGPPDCSCAAGCYGLYGCSSARPLVDCCARLAQYGTSFVEMRKVVVRSFHPNNIGSLVISHNLEMDGKGAYGRLRRDNYGGSLQKKIHPLGELRNNQRVCKGTVGLSHHGHGSSTRGEDQAWATGLPHNSKTTFEFYTRGEGGVPEKDTSRRVEELKSVYSQNCTMGESPRQERK
ncbi:unnamed protein product [Arctogadus glacialis]